MIDVRIHQLENGCTVLFRPTPDKQILSIVATVRWGARDDEPSLSGAASLMSRLLTKGTRTRSAHEIANTMESIGGSIEPFCTNDLLGMETQTVDADWPLALELLSDCLFEPIFSPDEFLKEQAFVEAEILRSEDEKFAFTYKQFQRLFYQGHLYERHPLGEIDAIRAIQPEQVTELHRQVFRPDQMLLTVVGSIPEDSFLKDLAGRWPVASATPPRHRAEAQVPPGAGGGKTIRKEKDVEQGFVILGYPAPRLATPENPAMRVASGILGEGMSSRLFSRLRDRDHLAYAVGSNLVNRELASHLALYIGTKPETVEQAREGMIREAEALLTEEISEEELQRAKRYIVGSYLVGRQTNSAVAHAMATSEAMGFGWDWPERLPERIAEVSMDVVREVTAKYLSEPAVAILSPDK